MEPVASNTRTNIINASLKLFAEYGYETVSVRDIASAAGIKASSIYGHFGHKEQILTECFNFYYKYRHVTRLEKDQYIPIIKSGTKEEVLQSLLYTYSDEILENMLYSLYIIYTRIYIDDMARDIYADEIDTSMKYLCEFFNTGIELGRFGEFNVPAVSLLLLSARMFSAHTFNLKTEQKEKWRIPESESFNEIVKIIPFEY